MATVLEPDVIRREVLPHGAVVRRQLAAVRRRLRRHLVCHALAWSIGVAALVIVTSFAADRWLRLGTGARLALLPIGLAILAATVYFRLVRPLRLPLVDLDLAVILDSRLPGIGQRVANVLQLPTLLEADPGASPSMIRAAVAEQAKDLHRLDWGAPFNRARMRIMALAIILPTVLLATAACAWPDTAALWARRWLLGSSQRWPQHTYLSIVGLGADNRLYVPRGESIMLEVDARPRFVPRAEGWTLPGRGEPLAVWQPFEPASELPEEVRIRYRQAGAAKLGALTHFTASRFRYELPPIEEPVEFSLTGGDDWLGPIRVEPLNRPGIQELKLTSQAPGRSEADTHSFASQDSQLLFLPGTQLELWLTSDMPLDSAQLVANAGAAPQFERRDERHFVARWPMSEPQTLEIKLIDSQAHLESKPYFISLNLLVDRVPRVAVRSTGVGRRVTPTATIPVALRAIDDFGLTSVDVEVEQSIPKEDKPEIQTHKISVAMPAPAQEDATSAPTEMESDQSASLKAYTVTPGNTIRLRGEATDNRAEGGQLGQSRWLTFQVVTPEELFYEILMVQRAQREKFRAALDMEKAVAAALEASIDAEQLVATGRKHQVAARQVSQVANRLDATLQEMTLNELGSSQARELLATGIIAPMRELHQGPIARLRSVLDQLAAEPSRTSELAPSAVELAQDVVAQMTRILDRMAQWESFVDVLNQVRQIIQLQNQVLDSTQKTKTERTNELFDE